MSRIIIEDIGDNGVERIAFAYPRGVIEDFLRFVTRPNRFIIEGDSGELVFAKVMKLRRSLLNARERVAPSTPEETPESVAPEFDGMNAVELEAMVDRIGARLEQLHSPKWDEHEVSVPKQLDEVGT